jgi:hypothetical protein
VVAGVPVSLSDGMSSYGAFLRAIRGVEKRPRIMEARMPCIGKTVITSETDAVD